MWGRRDFWRFVAGLGVVAFMVVIILHFFWRVWRSGGGEQNPGVLNIVAVRELGGGWLEVVRRVTPVMSTSVRIVAHGKEKERLKKATLKAVQLLLRLQKMLSRFDPDSELSRLCATAHKESFPVSKELSFLLKKALYWARMTDGALDITCVPLLEVYRKCAGNGCDPEPDDIKAALRRMGWWKIKFSGNRVRFDEMLKLDFGALAKGFAAQKAASLMRSMGIEHCLVEVGGEVYVSGGRFDGKPWRVGIKDPRRRGAFLAILALKEGAVATSGNYERYFATPSGRHSHIVDPRNGRTADAAVSVSVIAYDATDADALATALSVLGPKKGLALVEKLKKEGMSVEALFLWRDGEGERVLRSSGFSALEVK